MSKRQFPFDGSCPLQLKTHVNTTQFEKSNNMEQIYEKTLEALREGMDRYDNGEIEEETVKETVSCERCRQTKSGLAVTCAFCERKTCGDCRKQCAHCDKMFCSLCSVVNYDKKYERHFCLGDSPQWYTGFHYITTLLLNTGYDVYRIAIFMSIFSLQRNQIANLAYWHTFILKAFMICKVCQKNIFEISTYVIVHILSKPFSVS